MSLHRLRKADTLPAVGRDIDAWCTRCKLELGHVITAMNGAAVLQVRCHTCGSVHRYRDGDEGGRAAASPARRPGERAPRPAAARAAAKVAAQKVSVDRLRYDRLMADRDLSAAVPYAPSLEPEAGSLLAHSKFGVGVVEASDGNKAHVLFADGPRVMVVGRI